MQHPIQIDAAGGEYMEDVVIVEWGASLGDKVSAGDIVVVVETAKAATEVEAPADGYLVEILYQPGAEVPVGQRLGTIADSPSETIAAQAQEPVTSADAPSIDPSNDVSEGAEPSPSTATLEALQANRLRATPLARRIAAQKGLNLSQIRGSGPRNRIKLADVERAASALAATKANQSKSQAATNRTAVDPIVLLHGFADDKSGWRSLKPLLSHNHRILTPELPGHGDAASADVASLEDLAFAVSDQLLAEGVRTCHLVGHSLGGAVAVVIADLGLVDVRSLALIAPGGLAAQANTDFINGLANAQTPEALRPWLNSMVADPSVLPEGLARAAMRKREQTGMGPSLQAMAKALFGEGTQTHLVGDRLARLEMPLRAIWGTADAILPIAQADNLPPHAALHRFPDVGHVPQLEAPQLTARLLNEHIRSVD